MSLSASQSVAQKAWDYVLEEARTTLPPATVVMWFDSVAPVDVTDGVFQLAAGSQLVLERLQQNYLKMIEEKTSEALGMQVSVDIQVSDAVAERIATGTESHASASTHQVEAPQAGQAVAGPPASPQTDDALSKSTLLPFPGYTFDAFVPGPSNRFAHAAALAVAEAPLMAANYNPLFIYGGVGLGKTHLLLAVGHHMRRINPKIRVDYVTSEQFVTEFIKSVRERKGDEFRKKFRDTDCLLVDDIQFLAKREETQTEFFHTFNHLHSKGNQIVIASDRPPHELSGLEERLVSRFTMGLRVDVQPPDLETRIAILQLKVERDRLNVPQSVIEYIASKFDQSVRELEGALLRVVAWSELRGEPISQDLADQALQDLIPQNGGDISPNLIMEEIAAYYSISVTEIMSPNRSRPLAHARHIGMYLMRECTGLSLVKIGEIFGGRDHSTVLYSVGKVSEEMRKRDKTFREVQDLTRIVRGKTRSAR